MARSAWPRQSPSRVPAFSGVLIYYSHKSTGRPPSETDKYTSKYLDAPWTPLYPFGHGLSYTEFRLSNLRLSAGTIAQGGRVTVSLEAENAPRFLRP